MAKKIHIYDITMSNGEQFKNIRSVLSLCPGFGFFYL